MSQDLVKALGVKVIEEVIYEGNGQYTKSSVVFVDDLRAALEKLPVVYGFSDSEGNRFNDKKFPSDTHSARLFAIEEIEKKPVKVEVTKEQIAKAWDVMAKSNRNDEFNIFCKELGL